MMQVREILKNKKRSGQPLGVQRGDNVTDAIKIMVENDTGSCVVADAQGKLCGMLTFREVLELIHKNAAGLVQCKVDEIMDADPAVATPDDTVDQIRNLMTSRHIRYLPVMNEGRLSDVISFYDVARAVAKHTDFENRMLRQYINDWPEDS